VYNFPALAWCLDSTFTVFSVAEDFRNVLILDSRQMVVVSSDMSPQSLSPSQKFVRGMHLPVPGQRRRSDVQPICTALHYRVAQKVSHYLVSSLNRIKDRQ